MIKAEAAEAEAQAPQVQTQIQQLEATGEILLYKGLRKEYPLEEEVQKAGIWLLLPETVQLRSMGEAVEVHLHQQLPMELKVVHLFLELELEAEEARGKALLVEKVVFGVVIPQAVLVAEHLVAMMEQTAVTIHLGAEMAAAAEEAILQGQGEEEMVVFPAAEAEEQGVEQVHSLIPQVGMVAVAKSEYGCIK